MKATISALVLGLASASVGFAQPQGFNSFLPPLPSAPVPQALPPANGQYPRMGLPAPALPALPATPTTPSASVPWSPPSPGPLPSNVQAQQSQPTQFVPASPVPPPTVPSFIPPLAPAPMRAGVAQSPALSVVQEALPPGSQPVDGSNSGEFPMFPTPQAMPTPRTPIYYPGMSQPPSQPGGAVYQPYPPPPSGIQEGAVSQPGAIPYVQDGHDPYAYGRGSRILCDGPYCGQTSFWVNADYLMWWMKPGPNPSALAVTGPQTDRFPGALDQPNTTVLYGQQNINFNMFSGLRVSAGMWSSDQRWGLEASGFALQQRSSGISFSGDASGQPFIGIPFINARTGNENVYFVSQNFSDPSLAAMMTGSVNFQSTSQLWGYEANGLWNFYRSRFVNASLLAGFKSLRLSESLQMNESLRNLSPAGALTFNGATVDPSQSVSTYDRFSTQNTFYGGQLGTRLHFEYSRFSVDLTGKAALGVTQDVVNIAGGSALQDITGTTIATLPGGIFAQTSNIGRTTENKFAVVPEGNINLNYAVTDWCVLRAGYTFIFWNNVMRPGNQIDRSINPGLVPTDATFPSGGPNHPVFNSGQTSTFWTQGVNLGLELRF